MITLLIPSDNSAVMTTAERAPLPHVVASPLHLTRRAHGHVNTDAIATGHELSPASVFSFPRTSRTAGRICSARTKKNRHCPGGAYELLYHTVCTRRRYVSTLLPTDTSLIKYVGKSSRTPPRICTWPQMTRYLECDSTRDASRVFTLMGWHNCGPRKIMMPGVEAGACSAVQCALKPITTWTFHNKVLKHA